jgi:nitrogen regulatory protein PII
MDGLNLITCVVQRGFANEIISAAISAGAAGATYYKGHGTGSRQKLGEILSGLIIPEKDIITIIIDDDKKDAVFKAITEAGLLEKLGRGVAYSHKIDTAVGI